MRLQCLQQDDRSVDDNPEEFQYLLAHNDVMENEDQVVGHYLGGLQSSLQKAMPTHPCYTLTKAYQRTTAIEESHGIEIPRSKTSIPQCSKDKGV